MIVFAGLVSLATAALGMLWWAIAEGVCDTNCPSHTELAAIKVTTCTAVGTFVGVAVWLVERFWRRR
jgi:hypothetical protein